jgi:outer membrane protein TolC
MIIAYVFCGVCPVLGQIAPLESKLEELKRWDALRRGDSIYLSLNDAITLALENNLDLELQRYALVIADTDLLRARAGSLPHGVGLSVREGPRSVRGTVLEAGGASPLVGLGAETNLSIAGGRVFRSGPLPPSLDPVFVGGLRRDHQTLPLTNSFMAGTSVLRTDTTTGSLGFEMGFLTGGELNVGFDSIHQSLNNSRYDLNPFTSGGFGITFSQPLLRGFGVSPNSRFIRVAQTNLEVSDLVFQQQVIATVAGVIRLYWDLVSLREDVEVRRQTLERSEKFLSDTLAEVETGTRAPVEAVRARAEVARSRRDVITAEALVRQQETILKDYLSRLPVDYPELSGARLVPTDPIRVDRAEWFRTVEELSTKAMQKRPDLIQARLQIDNAGTLLEGSKNATLPSLDVVFSARNNGLAGDVNPLVLPGAAPHDPDASLVGGYGSALSQIARSRFSDYGVGIELTIPLRNRSADADLARDRLALRQQEIRLRLLEKQVRVEIENALTAIEQAGATIEAAEREREFQEQALAAEEEKLSVGVSTTYIVIQYQRDFAQARAAEVAAMAYFVKARAALDRALGELLPRHGISMEEVSKLPN